ncbi:unnamed protein product [Caenorhabditis angaria]|uniref:Cytoplasmic tRNA 2-thiolation protein 1 n=1 Tax=Caenorhabditis angaria TaxID=860376 RepID=A0A9P1N4E2_9PELO|nr:unnamed protein product [Caenorhabditis angaria]
MASEERGRSAYRSNCNGLSNYYRERFGSHSPEEYLNLRISGFDERLERDEIKAKLTHEFRRFAPFEIKVVRNPDEDERLAYVNFERQDCARRIRYNLMSRLREVLGRKVQCDPAGVLRDQEGKYIPDRFNRAQQNDKRGSGSNGTNGGANKPSKEPSTWRLKQDDHEATRTLFVGNMPSDVKEREIREIFSAYGKIEDIDIKTPINTDAAYAFVMFQQVNNAVEAKNEEQDRPVRTGGSRMKIGYGKSQVSRRLWVGGLGAWCDKNLLNKEFDRYGLIDKIDYEEGETFAYISFEDTHAAQDACRAMKGFALGGRDRTILVDFAKDPTAQAEKAHHFMRKRRASKSPTGPTTPPGSPKDAIRNFEDLDGIYASTWMGKMTLKKTEYTVKFYRVSGPERLVVKLLRDEDDVPLKLAITQRLGLVSQNALFDKLLACTSKELSLGVITAKKDLDELMPLVNYFINKDAAGVISPKMVPPRKGPPQCQEPECSSPAKVKMAKNGAQLCGPCFTRRFEDDVHQTIVENQLFKRGERVAIGASGGKDSTVLAYCMKTLNDRHDYGLDLQLLSIDEGIKGYRDDSLLAVEKNRVEYGLPLTILSYRDLYNWTMDEIVAKIGKKNNCTFCGVFRRQALDRGAFKIGAKKLVTGHNADDMAETVLMNVLRGDIARLERCTNIITGEEGDLPRAKPLKYCFERDIVMYARVNQLEYFYTECIYAPNSYRGFARIYVRNLEKAQPRAILDLIRSGEKLAVRQEVEMPKLMTCQRCGYITSQKLCKACLLIEGLNSGNTDLGVRKTKKTKKLTIIENSSDSPKFKFVRKLWRMRLRF